MRELITPYLHFRFGACFLVLLYASALTAQDSHNLPSDPDVLIPGGGVAAEESGDQSPATSVLPQYVPALDGSSLINLDRTKKTTVFYGGSLGYGWNSNVDDVPNGSSGPVVIVSPYIGVETRTNKVDYVFQYQPTIVEYGSSSLLGGAFHRATANLIGHLDGRWSWKVDASGSYGGDALRVLTPVPTLVVGKIVATNPSVAALAPNAGTVTSIDGGATLQFAKSLRDSFTFYAGDSFNRFSGFGENSSVATVQVTYARALTPRLALQTFGQSFYQYGATTCSSFGGGVGVAMQVSASTSFQVGGGPQINSNACGKQQGFAFHASIGTKLSDKSQLYVLANRQFGTLNLGPGLWQDNISAGYQRQLTEASKLSIDSGFVRSDALISSVAYRGVFVGVVYSHRIRRSLISSITYRLYNSVSGGVGTSQNVVMLSAAWAPLHSSY